MRLYRNRNCIISREWSDPCFTLGLEVGRPTAGNRADETTRLPGTSIATQLSILKKIPSVPFILPDSPILYHII